MKAERLYIKIFIWISAVVLIFTAHRAYAAPTYGTDVPKKKQISVGYQNNTVFRHDLSDSYGNVRSYQHYLEVSYGVASWFSLDGKIGMGNAIQRGGIYPKVEYPYGFAGGYGFRILALNDVKNRVRVALGFHHISVHPGAKNVNNNRYDAILDEWQCSVTASKDIGWFRPFLGIKALKSDLICMVNNIDKKWRPPKYFGGPVVGCTVLFPKGLSARIEGHFIDETSLSTGIYYTF